MSLYTLFRYFLLALPLLAMFCLSAMASAAPSAVPTFHSIGLYWSPPGASSANAAQVEFKPAGTSTWQRGLDLWYDARTIGARTPEYRGSIVELKSGTSYDVRLTLASGFSETIQVGTWKDKFPEGQTIVVPPGTTKLVLGAADSGTPTAYKVYTAPAGQNVIDQTNITTGNLDDSCVVIDGASNVIIRGLVLKNCKREGVLITRTPGMHDIVIEDTDIYGWGGGPPDSPYGDAAILCDQYNTVASGRANRIVVQRTKMHDPRYGANSWVTGHPEGPQPVYLNHCGTNHVFRYNEIYSSAGHHFNDGIGGADNMTVEGFPFADSDIYGNKISEANDDGIEAEGANQNVRIWGNYMSNVMVPIANAATSIGPLYVWRNVSNSTGGMHDHPTDPDNETDRGPFVKAGSDEPTANGGRAYYFHNTVLQPAPLAGQHFTMGAGYGIGATAGPLYNFVSRNNIWQIHKTEYIDGQPKYYSIYRGTDAGPIDAGWDLYNGRLANATETNGFIGAPTYDSTATLADTGKYWLAPGSLGYGSAQPLANFNDKYAQPDVGAHQSDTAPMKFGIAAYDAAGPTAALSASPTSGSAPLVVAFSAAGSTAGDSAIQSYHIDFGDGAAADAQQANHTYTAAGTYVATATVTDGNGLQSSATATVSVDASGSPVTLTLTPGSGVVHRSTEHVDITAAASDGRAFTRVEFYVDGVLKFTDTSGPFQYSWQSAAEAYGYHTLTVKATDAAGNVLTATQNLYALTRTCNVFLGSKNVFTDPSTVYVSTNTVAQGQSANVLGVCSGNETVTKVEFYVDDVLQNTDTAAPFIWAMNTGGYAVGTHNVRITGYLARGGVSNHTIALEILAP